MNNQFLEKRIHLKFCAKLDKDASVTCAAISKDYGGKAVKKSSVLRLHKWFEQCRHVEISNEDNNHHFLRH